MASDSSNVDRPGLIVTIILCPHCDGKYPVEGLGVVKCERCGGMFPVEGNEWEKQKERLFNDKPRLCRAICKGYQTCQLSGGCVKRSTGKEVTYWWQKED